MANVGRIKPQQKMACPSCRTLLQDFSIDEVAQGQRQTCPKCGQAVKLPDELVQRARQQQHLGRRLDITC